MDSPALDGIMRLSVECERLCSQELWRRTIKRGEGNVSIARLWRKKWTGDLVTVVGLDWGSSRL